MTVLTDEAAARSFVGDRCANDDLARLEGVVAQLLEENARQNLVSRNSLSQIWLRHIADSAQLLDHVPRETSAWLDLGSGAGFPGLVLAIMQPDRSFILVESRNLRIAWLQRMIGDLRMDNCVVVGSDVIRAPQFDAGVISARAFAPLDRLVALSARFSTAATHWVLPKGRSAAQEVAALPPHQRAMFHVEQSVTDAEAGIVVGRGKVEIDP